MPVRCARPVRSQDRRTDGKLEENDVDSIYAAEVFVGISVLICFDLSGEQMTSYLTASSGSTP